MNTRCWKLRHGYWELPALGGIMGILNVTPDSFSDGGRYLAIDKALSHAQEMIEEGADLIDIGGESTRPGSEEVDEVQEYQRVIPIISTLRKSFPHLKISVDTRHVSIARAAWEHGADIINDITGLQQPAMREFCASVPCGIILMHMQGNPRTMQEQPYYQDAVTDVKSFFVSQLAAAQADGIDPSRICLDPGIGFGKNVQHNLTLIRHLEKIRVQDLPLMMALSRKRFMGSILQNPEMPKNNPLPTVVMSLLAAGQGADLHRVHDVAPLRAALTLRAAFNRA